MRNQLRNALIALSCFCCAPLGAAAASGVAAPTTTHHIKTVFIILMENHNWTGDGGEDIKGNSEAPYINKTLLPMASHAEEYFNPTNNHPSLPNYLWLEAGTNFGILNDGPPSQNSQTTKKHLVTLLDAANVSWRAYLENENGKTCPLNDEGKNDPDGSPYFAIRHEPFSYFDNVTGHLNKHDAYCIDHLRPYGELAKDLTNNTVPSYVWITPNLCDDMHDNCSGSAIAHGDTWLSQNVPAILNSAAYQSGGALFITWDEALKGDGPIGMIVLSPFAKGNGYSNTIQYEHGSTLRTIEEVFGVTPLLRDAKNQQDLSDLFSVFP
jgi:hypothetical protein